MDHRITAEEAFGRLRQGNADYVRKGVHVSDAGEELRADLKEHGQHPFACVIACSDSRVIPETLFSVGLGDLFVIRVAGNVVDDYVLGSVEYAAEHLKTPLIVVLGHTECGAVAAALGKADDTHIGAVVTEIQQAIGGEHDPHHASTLNMQHSVDKIRREVVLSDETRAGLKIIGGIYNIETGRVDFLEEATFQKRPDVTA